MTAPLSNQKASPSKAVKNDLSYGLDYMDELDCMDGCNVHTVQFVHIVQSI